MKILVTYSPLDMDDLLAVGICRTTDIEEHGYK